MIAYEALVKFLQENEGKKMLAGIRTSNLDAYITFEEWDLTITNYDLILGDNKNELSIIDNADIEGFTEDKNKMEMFPEEGSFELYTKEAIIGFKLI